MSAMHLAKQAYSAFVGEKPHSSITDLVDILTSTSYEEESFDGIPELVESINLQPTGPTEASRAIRKKLKHGTTYQQYRALVLLKATVENGGHKFQTTFANEQLTDAIKHLASDPTTDPKVKKKLLSVLASWSREFQSDPRMSLVANLYKSVNPHTHQHSASQANAAAAAAAVEREAEYERKKKEEREAKEAKEEAKRKAKQAKIEEKQRKEEEARKRLNQGKRRPPFDFEKEKPQILNSIAETSQASNNLINALTLVNTEHESIQENVRVQECLEKAKLARKRVVRYIQLVENEELIGTLLDTNERVIAALETYDKLSKPEISAEDVEEVQANLAAVNIKGSEVERLQEKQRAAIERSKARAKERAGEPSGQVYQDLEDLDFGELGANQVNLPPPLRPSAPDSADDEDYGRGSLSDYSDYSSDEETHNRQTAGQPRASTSYGSRPAGRNHISVSDDEEVDARTDARKGLLDDNDDPFADPFADQNAVESSSLRGKPLWV